MRERKQRYWKLLHKEHKLFFKRSFIRKCIIISYFKIAAFIVLYLKQYSLYFLYNLFQLVCLLCQALQYFHKYF
jgi:hypothetical protein